MSPLRSELEVNKVGPQLYRLRAPLIYEGHTDTWIVPIGFETDLASVPRIIQWLLPHDGPYAPAAVVHDWLYRTRPLASSFSGPLVSCVVPTQGYTKITRKDADGVLRRIMRELGVSWWKRTLIYSSVRVFGRYRWNR